MPVMDHNRIAQMRTLQAEGWSLRRIGHRFGISRQRVQELLKIWAPDSRPNPQRCACGKQIRSGRVLCFRCQLDAKSQECFDRTYGSILSVLRDGAWHYVIDLYQAGVPGCDNANFNARAGRLWRLVSLGFCEAQLSLEGRVAGRSAWRVRLVRVPRIHDIPFRRKS